MSKGQMLRMLVKQRMTAAAEEIFGLFERTIAEYDEELCRSKEENERQRQLLDAVFKPQIRLHRAEVQQLPLSEEEGHPGQRDWIPSLDQEDQPQPPHIKEEQEELWTSQNREQLEELEEFEFNKLMFTPLPVKKEEEEEPQTSQLNTGADGEDRGGPEPAIYLLTDTDDKSEDSSETENEDWKEPGGPQSGWATKPFTCSQCGKRFSRNSKLNAHIRVHTGEKPFICSICSKRFCHKSGLAYHLKTHTGIKPYACSFCTKSFTRYDILQVHLRIHTGEKPFSCSLCSKSFCQKSGLDYHLKTHTRPTTYSCSICNQCFSLFEHLQLHMRTHSGEKPLVVKDGAKRFGLQSHLKCRAGEKPYSCSLCYKRFTRNGDVQRHMRLHTGEKPFSCKFCNRKFTWCYQVKRHKCVGRSAQLQDLWTNQEEEHLQGLEDAEITKFTFNPPTMKSEEHYEEKPHSSSQPYPTDPMKSKAGKEDCGGPEPGRSSDPEILESQGLMWNPLIGQFW